MNADRTTPNVGDAEILEELQRALARLPEARAAYDRMPPSHQQRYRDWIGEARRSETRARRITRAMEMILDWGRSHPGRPPGRPSN